MATDGRAMLLIGGPDAGKTNFLVRLWLALVHGKGDLRVPTAPGDISYVERAGAHLLGGSFAPHSSTDDGPRDFSATVAVQRGARSGISAEILVPDTLGELWSKAVATREIDPEWMTTMKRCDGALLFVRIHSEQLCQPPDWVTASKLMAGASDPHEDPGLPTDVFLCELLRFLEATLKRGPDGKRPRVGVVVTAWDLLDDESGAERVNAHETGDTRILCRDRSDESRSA